ncbi:MAG: response regulator transcription factor [Marinoscillum sp.]|uniref:response regulator n=1 Tax=Marinoscillum sp. TaxID=2024838 RepID=UPI0032F564A6|eukprot:TRINITY_DN2138_c0_g1_i1.p1 TRINITY_DN2138_c0_g1~~TRINITY_DN2138_c0_g1_i1.p1  ORF type:complete len:217 (+),score=12.38 TRINITY_DN2138_c0_g1_i1:55-705(+)
MKNKINILLIDDHPMIRDAIRLYFSTNEEIEILDEANNGQEALQKLKEKTFDLIITDMAMPDMNGMEFLTALQEQQIEQDVLVVSMINEVSQIKKMISLGAKGYVLKNSPKEEILKAIKAISAGDNYYSREVYDIIMGQLAGRKPATQRISLEVTLTKREKEIVKLIMEEHSNQVIADMLFISVRTVEAHKRNILEKTGCKTMAGLAIYAIEKGII